MNDFPPMHTGPYRRRRRQGPGVFWVMIGGAVLITASVVVGVLIVDSVREARGKARTREVLDQLDRNWEKMDRDAAKAVRRIEVEGEKLNRAARGQR